MIKIPSRLIVIAAVVVAIAAVVWYKGGLDLEALHAWAEDMNGALVFLALTVLPLVGFPVSVLHAVAGAKFGLGLGLALVGLSIALQLFASYAIDWLRQRLPPATHRSLTLFTMVLPGAPYFAQNYVLAVVGVPFRIFFYYSFPIHFGRSVIGVIFGEWSDDLTPGRIAVFVIYSIVVTVVCGLAFRRLRTQLQSPPRAANGRKRRA